jgi:EAL domain-containing protein (putative c-di-GMP-specific phosphodiesterase class I)
VWSDVQVTPERNHCRMKTLRRRPPFNATFAFQPIVDIDAGEPIAYEALVRGLAQEPASTVFAALPRGALHEFDREARCEAIRLAASLGLRCALSLNFLPQSLNTMADPISSALETAEQHGLHAHQLMLEVTESEVIHDPAGFAARLNIWRGSGVRLAIDDFGAGYAGLNLLAEFQPDFMKLDMTLVRSVADSRPRQAIVKAVLNACLDLGIEVIAEGVESEAELEWLRRQGVVLFQGYLLARPAFKALEISPAWQALRDKLSGASVRTDVLHTRRAEAGG